MADIINNKNFFNIDSYDRISKIVGPKKTKLKQSELAVKQHMKQLDIRRKALMV